jgi:hypothetical protein
LVMEDYSDCLYCFLLHNDVEVGAILHAIPITTPGETVTLYDKIIDKLIRNWAIGSAVWGVMIYYAVIMLLIIAFSFVMEFIDNRGK